MKAPRWVTPRRLGAAAAIYGVFVAGWHLGEPVTPACDVDQSALDRIAEEYETEPPPTPQPSATPIPSPTAYPSRYDPKSPFPLDPTTDPAHGTRAGTDTATSVRTFTIVAVPCTNDTSERPRLQAWLEGHWR